MIALVASAVLALSPVGSLPRGSAVYKFSFGFNQRDGFNRITNSESVMAYFVLPGPVQLAPPAPGGFTDFVISNPKDCSYTLNSVTESCSYAIFRRLDHGTVVAARTASGNGDGTLFSPDAFTVPGVHPLFDGSLPREYFGSLSFYQIVPEPTTWAMMALGFGVLGTTMRNRRKSGGYVLKL